ncbi:MAG: VOC family protein [Gammaproteobacteria bacterium]
MKFLHFGFRVHDIERTVAAYRELLGLEWEPVKEYATTDPQGRPARSQVSHAWTEDGTEIEMVQVDGGACLDDLVMGGREGISHVAVAVQDLAAEKSRALARGLKVVQEGSAPRASWFFIHDERLGGALVQMVQLHQAEGPLAVVQKLFEAQRGGDFQAVADLIADDAAWTCVGRGPLAFSCGKQEILRRMREFHAGLDGPWDKRITGSTTEGARVAVEAEARVRFKDGRRYDQLYHYLYEIENGRIKACREYMDSLYASQALSAPP